jgi:transposase
VFIRKAKNKSGNIAIQVVKKQDRHNTIVKHIGTARTPLEVSQLKILAQQLIDRERIKSGKLSLFDTRYEQSELAMLLQRVTFTGALDTFTYLFFSSFYHTIGFAALKNTCFKDLVIARIVDPCSKRRTRDVLESRFGKQYSLTTIYRSLKATGKADYQQKVENVVKNFVLRKLDIDIAVLFFDVTTLYYEAFDEDDFRKIGFSKDHKYNQPQVVVALTVTIQGLPLAMRIFEGNTFEGHTMLPCIKDICLSYALKQIVIVADAGMLSEENLKLLEEKKLEYIVGARLGSLSNHLFTQIVRELPKTDGTSVRIILPTNRILLVSYSDKRAKKDKHDREKQLKKAKDMLGKPTKLMRKYKFILSKGSGNHTLNEKLIEKAEQLEGMKGYVTNAAELTDEEIIQKYTELWTVEKSFRMSKSDLKARPIFHTLKESIQAHLLIVFTALVISRYVEICSKRSISKIVQILNQVKEIIVEDTVSKQKSSKYTNLTPEAKELVKLAKLYWVT